MGGVLASGGLRLDVCVLEFAYVQPTTRGGGPRGQGLSRRGEAFAGRGVGRSRARGGSLALGNRPVGPRHEPRSVQGRSGPHAAQALAHARRSRATGRPAGVS